MLQSESIDPIVPAEASALNVHWDMDGVLVDSEFLHTEKLTAVARRYGVEIRREYFAQTQTFGIPDAEGGYRQASMPLHGAGDKNIYHFLLTLKPRLRDELSMAQWLEEVLAYYVGERRRLQPRDRVAEVVYALTRRGAFQSIVTSGIRGQVEANFESLGPAAQCMAFALTADDVKYSKPNPQGYLISKDRANAYWRERGIEATDVIHVAIEDSPAGERAALDAGLYCIPYLLPDQRPVSPLPASQFSSVCTSAELAAALGLQICFLGVPPNSGKKKPRSANER